MIKSKKELETKAQRIKMILTDVDGVLTDGSMYYSTKGEELKKFNTKDGMAVELLLKIGIKTVFISKESSKIALVRAKKVKVNAFLGISNKELYLHKICEKYNLKPKEIAYIGDDINDMKIMKLIGLSFAPKDSVNQILKIANHICKSNGGEGVLREVAELIIQIKTKNK